MSFFVYQNWHRTRARLYRGGCSYCNLGGGTQPQDSGLNGKWYGPFDTRRVASSLMMSFAYADVGFCPFCKP